MKKFIFSSAAALAFLLASCDFGFDENSFQNKAGAYFKEMTSTASIEAYKISPAGAPIDKYGNICLSYEDSYEVEFTLRNPQHYQFLYGRNMFFSLADSGLPGSDLVSISQDSGDTTKLRMTFPSDFLMQNAAGANISPSVTLMHPVSLANFGVYNKLRLSSDAPPPKVGGALTMQTTETPSRWVLCFNLPSKAMVQACHNDIESVAVNGKTFAATVAADGTVSYESGSEISTVAPASIVANQNTGLSFSADENAAYFLTGDEADEKEKIYTVVVTDKAGLSSSLAVSTRGFKLGSPDAFSKTDTSFANKFKIYDSADPDGTKNSVEQDEDDSVYVAIKAVAKTASVDYTDPVTGETRHVDSYDYDKSDACVMWEVYRDEACSSLVGAGKINGLQGTISIPAGTSFVRAYVRKPLYSDSEVIMWKCRAVFTRFYVSEEGDDSAEGSRKKPFRTIQRAVDAFVDGIASGDCVADSLCDIRVMTDLTTPDSYDFSAHGGYLLNVADSSLASATIKVSGLGGTKTISASQAGSAVRKLVNAAVGKTVIQNINLTGGAALVTDDYIDSALILAAGAELDFNGSKVYGNTLSGERDSSANEGSVILSEGILKMSGTTVCDNAGIVTGSGSEAPVFYALWSCSGSAAASELTDCEFSGHGEGWTVVYVDSLPVKMTGGAIKNNVGCDAAVEATERVELSGVEISGNVCKTTAIDNYNDLILDGCTITGNVSKAAPASGKAAGVSLGLVSSMSITLKGANTIYDNHFESEPGRQSNLYIPFGKKITVGANISGSKIGVTMPFNDTTKPTKETPVVFTTGYATPSYANPDTPGSVFVSENDYGVAAIPSGVTDAGEAAFAVSSGGMYGPYDYTITTSAPSVVVAPGVAKSVALTASVTRKEPAGSTPPTTTLYYNPADRKLYLDDTFVTLAVEDRAGDPDYNKVSWTAALYAETSKACDVPISSSASGLTAEVPAMDLEYDYSLRITADFLGAGNHASFDYKVKNPFVSVAGASFDGSSAVPNSGVFIGGRKIKIKSLIACDHQVTQKEWFEVTGKTLRDQAGTSNIGYHEGDDVPINFVNWFDALVYCNKKSLADGLTPCYTISDSKNPNDWGDIPTSSSNPNYAVYSAVTCDWDADGWRLPTEAEWEYLARGGNLSATGQTKYSGSDNINEVCWCSNNITITPSSPQDVRTKAPNSLQLYDMSGNVSEWCWDRWIETVATDTPMTGPESGYNRACRGGSYGNTQTQDLLTVYGRTNQGQSYRSVSNGLRVVRSEDTATSYVLPTYCGSKAPGETLAVGDIVFDDGSATPYAAGLTLSDAQKARAIAVIYYTGSGSAGTYDLGEKTLGVGIKEWKYNQSLRLNGSSNSTTPKWSINAPSDSTASPTEKGADKVIVPNDHGPIIEAHKKNGLLTLALMKENVAEYNVAPGIIPDSPIFYWAEHYGEGSDKIAGNTALSAPYNSGWYLPGQVELRAIYVNKTTINSALDAIGSSAVKIAVGSTFNDDANIYHCATGTGVIYGVNLSTEEGGTSSSWRGYAWSVRAVRLFP